MIDIETAIVVDNIHAAQEISKLRGEVRRLRSINDDLTSDHKRLGLHAGYLQDQLEKHEKINAELETEIAHSSVIAGTFNESFAERDKEITRLRSINAELLAACQEFIDCLDEQQIADHDRNPAMALTGRCLNDACKLCKARAAIAHAKRERTTMSDQIVYMVRALDEGAIRVYWTGSDWSRRRSDLQTYPDQRSAETAMNAIPDFLQYRSREVYPFSEEAK